MKILIITHYFPPLNAVASHRPLGWAKHWAKRGHSITVLTTRKKASHGLLTESLSFDCSSKITIVPVKYPSPSAVFRKYTTHAPIRILLRAIKLFGLGVSKVTGFYFNQPHLWVFPGCKVARLLHEKTPFDAVVSTFSPPASHIIAAYLKKRDPNLFWIADFRDLWYGNHYYGGFPPFDRIEKLVQGIVLKHADIMTTVSPPLQKTLSRTFPEKPVYVFPNGFEPEQVESAKKMERAFLANDKIRIAYTGRIYRGKQNISCFFEALNIIAARNPCVFQTLEAHFYGVKGKILAPFLRKYPSLRKTVFLHRPVAHLTALRIQMDADLLLFLDWNDPRHPGVLTGKLFEYIASGTPILFIGPSLETSAAKIIHETQTGFFANNATIAADIIENFMRKNFFSLHPRTDKINAYSKESINKNFLDLIMRFAERSGSKVV